MIFSQTYRIFGINIPIVNKNKNNETISIGTFQLYTWKSNQNLWLENSCLWNNQLYSKILGLQLKIRSSFACQISLKTFLITVRKSRILTALHSTTHLFFYSAQNFNCFISIWDGSKGSLIQYLLIIIAFDHMLEKRVKKYKILS